MVPLQRYNAHHAGAAANDSQKINLWVRCVPAATALPNLNTAVEIDTLNGFFVGSFIYIGGVTVQNNFNEKFRFRRKCDENSLLQLLAESSSFNGTGRSMLASGMFAAVIRVK